MNQSGHHRFSGVYTALVTPLDQHGELDEGALKRDISYQLGAGVDGLHPCGTTGEFPLLTVRERQRIAEITITEVGGQVPVIVHVGDAATSRAMELAIHAIGAGADAVSITPPYYYTLDQAAILEHFKEITSVIRTEFPVFLYNIPQCTGNEVTPDVVARLTALNGNVVGIKDSQGDLKGMRLRLDATSGRGLLGFVGSDALIREGVQVGAVGVVSGNGNAFPRLVKATYDASAGRDDLTANRLQEKLTRLAGVLGNGSIPHIKAAMRLQGRGTGVTRSPLRSLGDDDLRTLQHALEGIDAEQDVAPISND